VDLFTELYARHQHTEHDNALAGAQLGSQVIAAQRAQRHHVLALARHSVTSVVSRILRSRRRQTAPTVGIPAGTHGGTR
jgi:hypothetical protein